MSQMNEFKILRGKLPAPDRWSCTLLAAQYKKMIEIKYSRIERGANEQTSFCSILCEALDLLHSRESEAGKITVRAKECKE